MGRVFGPGGGSWGWKMVKNHRFFYVFCNVQVFYVLVVLETVWERFRSHLGAILELSWAVLGGLGGRLGAVLGGLGAVPGHLRGPLGCPRVFWTVLGASWAVSGSSWAVLGPCWARLGASWASFGPSWGRLGALLGGARGLLERNPCKS